MSTSIIPLYLQCPASLTLAVLQLVGPAGRNYILHGNIGLYKVQTILVKKRIPWAYIPIYDPKFAEAPEKSNGPVQGKQDLEMRIFPVLKPTPLKNDPPSPAGRSYARLSSIAKQLPRFFILERRDAPNELTRSCIAHHCMEVFEVSGSIYNSNKRFPCNQRLD